MQHDFFDCTVGQIQGAQDAVPVLFFNQTLLVAQSERSGDFFAHGQNICIRIRGDAE